MKYILNFDFAEDFMNSQKFLKKNSHYVEKHNSSDCENSFLTLETVGNPGHIMFLLKHICC